jgi:hypothetical protein
MNQAQLEKYNATAAETVAILTLIASAARDAAAAITELADAQARVVTL